MNSCTQLHDEKKNTRNYYICCQSSGQRSGTTSTYVNIYIVSNKFEPEKGGTRGIREESAVEKGARMFNAKAKARVPI